MNEPQLVLVDADGKPSLYPCPTCHGDGECLRVLYPDEREAGGAFVAMRRCPTCQGQGTVEFDPRNRNMIPF